MEKLTQDEYNALLAAIEQGDYWREYRAAEYDSEVTEIAPGRFASNAVLESLVSDALAKIEPNVEGM